MGRHHREGAERRRKGRGASGGRAARADPALPIGPRSVTSSRAAPIRGEARGQDGGGGLGLPKFRSWLPKFCLFPPKFRGPFPNFSVPAPKFGFCSIEFRFFWPKFRRFRPEFALFAQNLMGFPCFRPKFRAWIPNSRASALRIPLLIPNFSFLTPKLYPKLQTLTRFPAFLPQKSTPWTPNSAFFHPKFQLLAPSFDGFAPFWA